MKPIRWLALALTGAAPLAGCETAGVAPAPPPISVDAAEKAEREGEYLLAAREYMRLAEIAVPPRKQDFELRAVDAERFLVLPDRNARIAYWTKRLARPLYDRQMRGMGARIHRAEQDGASA